MQASATQTENDQLEETYERGTLGSVIGSLGLPIIIGLVSYWGFLFALEQGWVQSELLVRYLSAHPVSYIATGMFFVGLASLGIKLIGVVNQILDQKNVKLSPPPALPQRAESSRLLLAEIDELPAARQNSYMGNRLRAALDHVDKTESANGLDEELKYLSDMDAARQQESFALTRILIWAIPMLGFLGTVIGISGALGGLSVASEFETMLSNLRDKLYVAFDTTALALTLSIILMFAQFVVNRIETQYLQTVDDAVSDELAGRFITFGGSRDPYLSSVENMSRNVLDSIREMGEKQSETWQNGLLKISDATDEVLGNFAEVLATRLSAQLDNILGEFGVALRGSINDSNVIMSNHAKQLAETVTCASQSMETHRTQFGELLSSTNNHLRETFELVIRSVDEKAESMQQHITYTTDSLKDYNRQIITEFSDLIKNESHQEKLAEAVTGGITSSLSGLVDNTAGTLGEITSSLSGISESIGGISESLGGISESVDAVKESSAESLGQVANELTKEISKTVNTQEALLQSQTQQSLVVSQLSERFVELSTTMQTGLAPLENLDETLTTSIQAMSQQEPVSAAILISEVQSLKETLHQDLEKLESHSPAQLIEEIQSLKFTLHTDLELIKNDSTWTDELKRLGDLTAESLERIEGHLSDDGGAESIDQNAELSKVLDDGLQEIGNLIASQQIGELMDRIEKLTRAQGQPTEHQLKFLDQQKQTIENQNELLDFCSTLEQNSQATFLDTSKKILEQHAEAATKAVKLEETVRELSFSIHLLNQSLATQANQAASTEMRFTKPDVPKRVA